MKHIKVYLDEKQALLDSLATAKIDEIDAEMDLKRAMSQWKKAKVVVAQAEKALKHYDETGNTADTDTF